MSGLIVRTNDAILAAAVKTWWAEESAGLPEGSYCFTDLDGFERLGVPGEVTCSRTEGKRADLLRPFSFARLKELFTHVCGQSVGRLVYVGETPLLDGEELKLTRLENAILKLLYTEKRPLSAEEIARRLNGGAPRSNKIGVYISYLRKKTGRQGRPPLIVTKRKEGYMLSGQCEQPQAEK